MAKLQILLDAPGLISRAKSTKNINNISFHADLNLDSLVLSEVHELPCKFVHILCQILILMCPIIVFGGQIPRKLRIVLIPLYLLRILMSCCYVGVSSELKSAMPITALQLDTTASTQDDLA